jgi:Arc/MetJ-type ribon-helix-helix transcriptional regulator
MARVTIVLDEATRHRLRRRAGAKNSSAYVRLAVAALLEKLAAGVAVPAVPISGALSNFSLKVPRVLLEDAALYTEKQGCGTYVGLSEMVRTAVSLMVGK